MGVDKVIVRPVPLRGWHAIQVQLAHRRNRTALLAVEDVAVNVEHIGERVERKVLLQRPEGWRHH